MIETELIENARNGMVDDVIDAGGMVIEGGHGRQHQHAGAGQGQHVFQVNYAERRFARHQHQSMTADGEAMMARMIEQAKSAEALIAAGLDAQDVSDLKRLLSKLGGLRQV